MIALFALSIVAIALLATRREGFEVADVDTALQRVPEVTAFVTNTIVPSIPQADRMPNDQMVRMFLTGVLMGYAPQSGSYTEQQILAKAAEAAPSPAFGIPPAAQESGKEIIAKVLRAMYGTTGTGTTAGTTAETTGTTGTTSATTQAAGTVAAGQMTDLEAKYTQLDGQYNRLVDEALAITDPVTLDAKVREITAVNQQLTEVLNQMIAIVAQMKENTGNIRVYRDQLTTKLTKIQRDYNGLIQNTDKLETLRRIRQHEEVLANKSLYMYLGIFLVACLVLLLVLILRRPQTMSDTMVATPTSSTVAPIFT
jgi:hypothetical protein